MKSGGLTQAQQILKHLRDVGPLTPIDALELFGCFRLGARIWDLNQEGHGIQTELITREGKTFARYSLPTGQLPLFQQKGLVGGSPSRPLMPTA